MPSCSLRTLLLSALAYRLAVATLLELAASCVPLFDRSPDAVLPRTSFLQPFVRWDVLWFLPVALRGTYASEQETAFGWGWIGSMRALGRALAFARGRVGPLQVEDVVLGGLFGSWAAGIAATGLLFVLTLRLTRSTSFARATTALYILSPSPAALVSPYTEPLYACLTFVGMLAVLTAASPSAGRARHAALLACATVAFAGSTATRPTGLLNAGFLVWYLVVNPWLKGHRRPIHLIGRLVLGAALTCAVASPFVYAQKSFYDQFCVAEEVRVAPNWCASRLPLLYTHVQREYWDVGFLAYWELKQLPNFAIAAPVYGLLAIHHAAYLRASLPFFLRRLGPSPRSHRPSNDKQASPPPYLAPALLPFVLHSVAITLLLFVNSHVQIALRLAQTNPVFYWAAAALLERPSPPWASAFWRYRPDAPSPSEGACDRKEWEPLRVPYLRNAGLWYLRWVVVWGAVTTILWAGFFPPA